MDEDRKKQLSAAVTGLFDPWIRKKAQEVASKVPEDSILRSKVFESVLGSIKGFFEAWVEKLPVAISIAAEKATDFSDFLAGALGSNAQIVESWVQEFITDSFRRLREAEDPQAEFERIETELGLRKRLLKLIPEGQGKEIGPETRPENWADGLIKIFGRISKADQNIASKVQGWRDRQKWIKKGR